MRKLITILAFLLIVCHTPISQADEQTSSPTATSNKNTQQAENLVPENTDKNQKLDEALKTFILSKNPSLGDTAAANIVQSINSASSKYGMDRELIAAVIWIESTYNPNTVSGNCIGLMQIHVNTGKALGLSSAQLYNSDLNIKHGTKYLSTQIAAYKGDVLKGLSAYNQGPARVNSGEYSTWYQDKVSQRWNQIEKYIADYITTH